MFSADETLNILTTCGIPVIDPSTNYWFIRTNGGDNFENFYFGQYVAIGWDKIDDLDFIKHCSLNDLKDEIIESYPDDSKPGSTASQIMRFVNDMKIGDYVLVPGANCDRIAIGQITSDPYIYEASDQERIDVMFFDEEISYLKRRNVNWIADRPFERRELDPMLIPIIYSYGTIVNANPYSGFINRTLYSCYIQGKEMHAIFDVTTTQNIAAVDLYNFIDSIFESADIYSELYNIPIEKNEFSIKAAINSPGPVEIITCATSAFLLLTSLSLFINGAKVKFSFDIFKIIKGNVDIDSPGLIDKIRNFQKIATENEIKLKETEAKIEESRKKLKIRKKENRAGYLIQPLNHKTFLYKYKRCNQKYDFMQIYLSSKYNSWHMQ